MRRGGVGLCVATLIARYVKPGNKLPGWHSPEIAWAQTQGQLAWYRAMEEAGEMMPITDAASLERQVALWTDSPGPQHADRLRAQPRRRRFDSHAAASRAGVCPRIASHRTRPLRPGNLRPRHAFFRRARPRGRELLAEMHRLGIILDATHLSDESFWEALEVFPAAFGPATTMFARSRPTRANSPTSRSERSWLAAR